MSPTSLVRPFLVSAFATWMIAGISAAQTAKDDPKGDPVAVLRTAGLQKLGNSFVLESEIEANTLEKEVEKTQIKIEQVRRKQQEGQYLLSQAKELRAQAAQLRGQAATRREQKRTSSGKKTSRNDDEEDERELTDKAERVDQQAKQLELQARQRMDPNIEAVLLEYSKQINDDQVRYQVIVDRTLAAYEELYKQEDVVAALRKLNHLARRKVALGPVALYTQNLARLCSDQLIDMGMIREKDIFSPTGQELVAQQVSEFALRYQKAKKAGGTDPEMKNECGALRKKAQGAEDEGKRMAADAVVKDLLAEVQKSQKPKIRVGTSLRLQRALNDLKSIEKDFTTPAKK